MITHRMPGKVARSQTGAGKLKDFSVDIDLTWDPDRDPFAVTMTISDGLDNEVVWIFSRQLLADGLQSLVPVGQGDVKIRLAGEGRVSLVVCLTSCTGHADLLMPVQDVEAFLRETNAHTQLGEEDTAGLVDEFLKEFG